MTEPLISKDQLEKTKTILSVVTEEERRELLLLYTLMVDYAAALGLGPVIQQLVELSFSTTGKEFRDRAITACKKIQVERDKICPTEFPGSNEVSRSYSAPEGPDTEKSN